MRKLEHLATCPLENDQDNVPLRQAALRSAATLPITVSYCQAASCLDFLPLTSLPPPLPRPSSTTTSARTVRGGRRRSPKARSCSSSPSPSSSAPFCPKRPSRSSSRASQSRRPSDTEPIAKPTEDCGLLFERTRQRACAPASSTSTSPPPSLSPPSSSSLSSSSPPFFKQRQCRRRPSPRPHKQ